MRDQVFCFSITELQLDPINPSVVGGWVISAYGISLFESTPV